VRIEVGEGESGMTDFRVLIGHLDDNIDAGTYPNLKAFLRGVEMYLGPNYPTKTDDLADQLEKHYGYLWEAPDNVVSVMDRIVVDSVPKGASGPRFKTREEVMEYIRGPDSRDMVRQGIVRAADMRNERLTKAQVEGRVTDYIVSNLEGIASPTVFRNIYKAAKGKYK
jgi:hypothetical protein